jgi:hypothetical protein
MSGTMSPPSGMNGAAGRWCDRLEGVGHPGLIVRVLLDCDNPPAMAGDVLPERRLHDRPIGILRHQRRKGPFAGRDCVLDDALDIRFGQEAQQINARRSDAGIGRKGNDWNIGRPRHLPDGVNRLRKQGPKNDLRALLERLLGRAAGGIGIAGIVADHDLDVGLTEFGHRHVGGIAHGLAGQAGIAGG